jgi:hypothetical protein
LAVYWHEPAGRELDFGPQHKLINLLLKNVARWTHFPPQVRERLQAFLHVPLDEYSLVAIRQIDRSLRIPRKPGMSFVKTPDQYQRIQSIMREISREAGVPPIYIDLVAWNSSHEYCG